MESELSVKLLSNIQKSCSYPLVYHYLHYGGKHSSKSHPIFFPKGEAIDGIVDPFLIIWHIKSAIVLKNIVLNLVQGFTLTYPWQRNKALWCWKKLRLMVHCLAKKYKRHVEVTSIVEPYVASYGPMFCYLCSPFLALKGHNLFSTHILNFIFYSYIEYHWFHCFVNLRGRCLFSISY